MPSTTAPAKRTARAQPPATPAVKLADAGLLLRDKRGNQQIYRANTTHPIFAELASILRKTSGLADVLVQVVLKPWTQAMAGWQVALFDASLMMALLALPLVLLLRSARRGAVQFKVRVNDERRCSARAICVQGCHTASRLRRARDAGCG